jgi:hypothetical protein
MIIHGDVCLNNWSLMTINKIKALLGLVALVNLIDPGVLVSLSALLALMAFQGMDDLMDMTNKLC